MGACQALHVRVLIPYVNTVPGSPHSPPVTPPPQIEWRCRDGERVSPGHVLGVLRGSARSILVAERIMLNFMQVQCDARPEDLWVSRGALAEAREGSGMALPGRITLNLMQELHYTGPRCTSVGLWSCMPWVVGLGNM